MRVGPWLLTLACALLAAPGPLAGQAHETAAHHIALGDTATRALDPQTALRHSRTALARACMYGGPRRALREPSSLSIGFALPTRERAPFHTASSADSSRARGAREC